jgi:hypothetical protein
MEVGFQPLHLVAQRGILVQFGLHLFVLVGGERLEQVAEQMVTGRTGHGNADGVWFQASFNLATAACMRLFTVPAGMSRTSAASRYFISWK